LSLDGVFELYVFGNNFIETLFETLDMKKKGGRVHDDKRITISKKIRQRKKIDSYLKSGTARYCDGGVGPNIAVCHSAY
jgi:hypothetical protein